MRAVIPGLALIALAAGCAGPSPFDDRAFPHAEREGVSARWLDELYRRELAAPAGAASAEVRSPRIEEDDLGAHSTLDDLLAYALARHPSVQAAQAEWLAARERIVQARTLPDPQLSYGIMVEQIDRGSGGREPIAHSFGLTQMFPWFGKLDARAAVQVEAARAAEQRLIAEQVRVLRVVKEAYAEYAYLAIASGIVGEHRELLGSVEEVVRIRYRAAAASLADLLRVQAEGDRLEVEERDLLDMITATQARLNAAIGRRAEAPLPQPVNVHTSTRPNVQMEQGDQSTRQQINGGAHERSEIDRFGHLDVWTSGRFPPPWLSVALRGESPSLLGELAEHNPELRVRRAEIAARRQAMRVAELEYYPDVMLGVEYGLNAARRMSRMDGGGSDTLTGMISINVPLWREKYDAGSREALAEFGASLRSFTSQQNTLEAELKMALYGLRDAERRRDLFGEVLRERGEQVLEATLTAYRGGEASFTDLIQAQRELLEFELAHQRARADRFIRIAEIESLIGRPLSAETGLGGEEAGPEGGEAGPDDRREEGPDRSRDEATSQTVRPPRDRSGSSSPSLVRPDFDVNHSHVRGSELESNHER